MNTKRYLALVAALFLTFMIFSPALAEKSYLAERFDVNIAVQPDGTLFAAIMAAISAADSSASVATGADGGGASGGGSSGAG